MFFLAAEAEGTRNKAVLNSWGNAVRDRQEKSSTVFLAAEGTRNHWKQLSEARKPLPTHDVSLETIFGGSGRKGILCV